MPAEHTPRATRSRDVEKGTSMTDTSPTASGSPSPRRGRVFRAAAPRQPQDPQPVLDEELTAPAGYGSSAAPPSGHDRAGVGAATPVGAPAPYTGTKGDVHAEVLVLGAGPGGYTAAFRAADLGRQRRDGRLPRPARRGLPQRRLHPVQSPAARRQGHRRNQGDDPRRPGLPRPHHRPRRAARLERQRRHPPHRRPDRPGQTTQSHHHRRHRHLHRRPHASPSPPRTAPRRRCRSTPRSSPPAPNR